MKILTFKQFVELPDGVIYAQYEPAICRGLFKRGEVIRNESGEVIDFLEADLLAGPGCPPPSEAQNHIVVDTELYGRWALYEYDALFAVYEASDLVKIRDAMETALGFSISAGSDYAFPMESK